MVCQHVLNGMRIESIFTLRLVHIDFVFVVNVVCFFIWVNTDRVSLSDFGLSLGGFAPFEILWPVW